MGDFRFHLSVTRRCNLSCRHCYLGACAQVQRLGFMQRRLPALMHSRFAQIQRADADCEAVAQRPPVQLGASGFCYREPAPTIGRALRDFATRLDERWRIQRARPL